MSIWKMLCKKNASNNNSNRFDAFFRFCFAMEFLFFIPFSTWKKTMMKFVNFFSLFFHRYLLIIEPGLLLSMKISWNIIRSIDRLIERQQSILIGDYYYFLMMKTSNNSKKRIRDWRLLIYDQCCLELYEMISTTTTIMMMNRTTRACHFFCGSTTTTKKIDRIYSLIHHHHHWSYPYCGQQWMKIV